MSQIPASLPPQLKSTCTALCLDDWHAHYLEIEEDHELERERQGLDSLWQAADLDGIAR